jgi:hypothetical protein
VKFRLDRTASIRDLSGRTASRTPLLSGSRFESEGTVTFEKADLLPRQNGLTARLL